MAAPAAGGCPAARANLSLLALARRSQRRALAICPDHAARLIRIPCQPMPTVATRCYLIQSARLAATCSKAVPAGQAECGTTPEFSLTWKRSEVQSFSRPPLPHRRSERCWSSTGGARDALGPRWGRGRYAACPPWAPSGGWRPVDDHGPWPPGRRGTLCGRVLLIKLGRRLLLGG
jgi:hypothetical protein